MDGYSNDVVAKYIAMEELMNQQSYLNNQIILLSSKLEEIPKAPKNLNKWITSISGQGKKSFKLSDFSNLFNITKEYNKLKDRVDENSRELKVAVIESIIDRINNILKK